MITLEKLDAVKGVVDKLMTQGQMLYDDITETAKDRARLLSEVTEHEQTIDKLNGEIADLQARNRDLELRNSRLVDDLMKFETQYNEASALLDSVRATVDRKRGNGNLASLLDRARQSTDKRPTGQMMTARGAPTLGEGGLS
jgi:hypothetical protein